MAALRDMSISLTRGAIPGLVARALVNSILQYPLKRLGHPAERGNDDYLHHRETMRMKDLTLKIKALRDTRGQDFIEYRSKKVAEAHIGQRSNLRVSLPGR
jgi:hypothetical protein